MLPYGVEGEIAASLEVSNELMESFSEQHLELINSLYKCFDSSKAIFVKSEKKAGGRLGWLGPKRAMMSQLCDSELRIG